MAVAAAAGASNGWFWVPAAAAVPLIGAIAVFNVVAVRAPVKRAVVIGVQQMTFGIAVVAVTALAVLL